MHDCFLPPAALAAYPCVVVNLLNIFASSHGVPGVDGIILTHDHADAMLGLDDVRSVQVLYGS